MTGTKGILSFVSPRPSVLPEARPREVEPVKCDRSLLLSSKALVTWYQASRRWEDEGI